MSADPPRYPGPLPLARWHEAVALLPADFHRAYYDMVDALSALAASIARALPMDGASVVATVFPTELRGRVTWQRPGSWLDWSVRSSL